MFEANRAPWMANAACTQIGPHPFFPRDGESTRDAKRVCSICPVASDCLEYAIRHGERFGVWGGKSENERRKLRREAA